MGQLVETLPSDVRPTQEYLNLSLVEKYAEYVSTLSSPLVVPATPSGVSRSDTGVLFPSYALLDGHHAVSGAELAQKELLLWIPENPRDRVPAAHLSRCSHRKVQDINGQIQNRWDSAGFYVPSIAGKELVYMQDLLQAQR